MVSIKHYINPLHVYCRLRDIGLEKHKAIGLCRLYEKSIFRRVCLVRWKRKG
jgi:hypothetical protein